MIAIYGGVILGRLRNFGFMADRLIVAHGNGLRSAPMVLSCHRITIPEKDVNHHGDQWDPVPSHEILDFFFFLSFSLFLYSVYDIPCRIVSNEYMRGCFERFRRWLCVKKMKKFGERNTKFLFLWGFEVFGYVRFESFFFLMQKKLINFWVGLSY